MNAFLTLSMIGLTIFAYLVCRKLAERYKHPLLNVVVLSSLVVVAVLLLGGIPYARYEPGKDIITLLLGPATTALAIPLYTNRALLKKHAGTVALGVLLASALTSITAVEFAQWAGLPKDVVISVGPKSVTAPVAAEVAKVNGGDPGLAIAFVIITGALGAVFGPPLLTLLKVSSPIVRGLALGTLSHGQGTATALLEGEKQGLMAGIGMALSALVTSTLFPLLLPVLLD